MSEHLEGRPVSASTYRNQGCRCDGCRAASTESTRLGRRKASAEGRISQHVFQRQLYQLCAAEVREEQPDRYEELKLVARRKVRARREQS